MHPFCKGEHIFLSVPECKLELKNKFMICSIVRPSAQGAKKDMAAAKYRKYRAQRKGAESGGRKQF